MTKLPIQSLLYLVSLGLALGSGWIFYRTMMQRAPQPEKDFDLSKELVERGRGQTPDDRLDDYSGKWWMGLREVNWIGKVEAPPEAPPEPVAEKPKTPDNIQPREVLDVVCIAFFRNGGQTRVVVRYKPEIDVEVPAELSGRGAGGAAGSAGWNGPADSALGNQPPAKNNRGGPSNPGARTPGASGTAAPGMPAFSGPAGTPDHLMEIGETLWPPYQDFYLAAIRDDAKGVFFRRKSQSGEGEVPAAEVVDYEVPRNELQLDPDVLERVYGFRAPTGRQPSPSSSKPENAKDESDPSAPASSWIEVEETRAISPGQYHISRADDRLLRDHGQTIFNDDISLRTYDSGKIRGVQVTKISAQLQRFGVQNGDVLLEVNGVPVTSKAEALKVGKDQYKRGVRTFRAKIMTAWGRVEERTWHAPEK